jgi:hypothetical protein
MEKHTMEDRTTITIFPANEEVVPFLLKLLSNDELVSDLSVHFGQTNGYITDDEDDGEIDPDDIVPADVLFEDLKQALTEVKLHEEGKLKFPTWSEVLDEIHS